MTQAEPGTRSYFSIKTQDECYLGTDFGVHLFGDSGSFEQHRCLGGVRAQAPDEVGAGVHQRPEQVVEARVEVLRERGRGGSIQCGGHRRGRTKLSPNGAALRYQCLQPHIQHIIYARFVNIGAMYFFFFFYLCCLNLFIIVECFQFRKLEGSSEK